MSDKLQWFKFSPSNWMMGRIRKMDKVVQSDFLALCCVYWNKECKLSLKDSELEIGKESLEKLLEFEIVKQENTRIGIEFLDLQLDEINQTSEQKRDAAYKRWNAKTKHKDAGAMHVHKSAMPIDKIREEEKREDKEEIKLNDPLNKNFEEETDIPEEVKDLAFDISNFLNIPNPSKGPNHGLPWNLIKCFVRNLHKWGEFEILKEQFKYYKIAKKEPKYRHGHLKFIGDYNLKYADGAWNEKNWREIAKDTEQSNPTKLTTKFQRYGN